MKKKIKKRYVFLFLLVIIFVTPFVIWYLKPSDYVTIVVLNKTFPIQTDQAGVITSLDYSKQRGLYWIVNHRKIKNSISKKTYKEQKDYYGNFLEEGKLVNRPLEKLSTVPDVLYLSDMYGTGKSKVGGEEATGVSGLTKEEVGLVSTYYARGTTIIGEYNIAGDPTTKSVSKELETIFGLNFTGVAGKFFSDLTSKQDVPEWIRNIYEQQYGKRWNLTGGGIVIAGNDRIVVLQRGIDFTGKSITIAMSEEAKKTYKTEIVDYYNWFEFIEPNKDSKILASYDIQLTEKGENQLKPFGIESTFPAIIEHRSGNQYSLYFAGDFTDYRAPEKIKSFIGAPSIYKYFSVNEEGDLSYFYWHFYVPLLSQTLKEIQPLDQDKFLTVDELDSEGTRLMSKVDKQQFTVYHRNKWKSFYVKGVNIGSSVPGSTKDSLPTDQAFYSNWFDQIGAMNANTIRVYELMPPAFYQALDTYNYQHTDEKLYLLQSISIGGLLKPGHYLTNRVQENFSQVIEETIHAIHGNLRIRKNNDVDEEVYMSDVSSYVVGYMIDSHIHAENVSNINGQHSKVFTNGEYVRATEKATITEKWLASLSDKVVSFEQQHYQMQHPIGVVNTPELDAVYLNKYSPLMSINESAIDLNQIVATEEIKSGFFSAYDVYPNTAGLTNSDQLYKEESFLRYKEYINKLKSHSIHPLLISEFGISTANSITEKQQADGLVSLIQIIKDSGALGGLLYEWSDEWGKSSDLSANFMIPHSRGVLWHNTIDPAQNYGILASDAPMPTSYSLNLRGTEFLHALSLTTDETYFHMKVELNKLPNFDDQKLMIYLDTMDRKNGEYMLAPDINENWSGAEFNIAIEGLSEAQLLVIPTYNSAKGSYYSAVSTTGLYEKMERQLSKGYIAKSGAKIPAVLDDGSTLIEGDFETSNNHFYFDGNTLHLRIPWARLNFTDPSNMLVLDDEKSKGVHLSSKSSLSVKMTDGIVPSVVVMNKETNKVDYQFPESVTSTGYRTFSWHTWDEPTIHSRKKTSYENVKEIYSNY
ncbi:hypothetical protein DV702_11030 [Sporosarcina sp. PTS2304]|uniref:hypothetical protein n=1 Tax=Sporosarcina sp. PTS2304 TaxID=2283194 RepID=UPI000E0CEEE4|nr:hypothetical protein [Sporosarcina sp. PTS2304]AXI00207.1 hypothetical protein DV702_11030 [Sporosarcina sp. PTS2304]